MTTTTDAVLTDQDRRWAELAETRESLRQAALQKTAWDVNQVLALYEGWNVVTCRNGRCRPVLRRDGERDYCPVRGSTDSYQTAWNWILTLNGPCNYCEDAQRILDLYRRDLRGDTPRAKRLRTRVYLFLFQATLNRLLIIDHLLFLHPQPAELLARAYLYAQWTVELELPGEVTPPLAPPPAGEGDDEEGGTSALPGGATC